MCLHLYVYVTFDGCCLGRVCLSTLAMIMISEFRSIVATIEIVLKAQTIVECIGFVACGEFVFFLNEVHMYLNMLSPYIVACVIICEHLCLESNQ
jgi:hypothetical protein